MEEQSMRAVRSPECRATNYDHPVNLHYGRPEISQNYLAR